MYDHYSLAKSVEYGVFNFVGKGRDRAGPAGWLTAITFLLQGASFCNLLTIEIYTWI